VHIEELPRLTNPEGFGFAKSASKVWTLICPQKKPHFFSSFKLDFLL